MDLYNFLLRKNGYDTEDYAYLLFYYPDKINEQGDVIFHTTLITLPTNPDNGELVFKNALKLLQQKEMPPANEQCAFCTWIQDAH